MILSKLDKASSILYTLVLFLFYFILFFAASVTSNLVVVALQGKYSQLIFSLSYAMLWSVNK
jgi:hypothetical protein